MATFFLFAKAANAYLLYKYSAGLLIAYAALCLGASALPYQLRRAGGRPHCGCSPPVTLLALPEPASVGPDSLREVSAAELAASLAGAERGPFQTVVAFRATWSKACRQFDPVFADLSRR